MSKQSDAADQKSADEAEKRAADRAEAAAHMKEKSAGHSSGEAMPKVAPLKGTTAGERDKHAEATAKAEAKPAA